jgi:hypothetical protein
MILASSTSITNHKITLWDQAGVSCKDCGLIAMTYNGASSSTLSILVGINGKIRMF